MNVVNPVGTRTRTVTTLPAAIGLAPFLIGGWGLPLPSGDLRWLSGVLFAVTAIALVRFVAGEVQLKHRRLLILGSGPMAGKLIEEIEANREPRYVVAGIVDDEKPTDERISDLWLGTSDQLAKIVADVRPARILVAVADRRKGLPLHALLDSRVKGVEVEDAVDFYEQLTGKMAIEALRPSMLILAKGFRNHGAAEITARIVSVVAAVVGLLLVSPVLATIALLVKLDSRGPVLFVQERAGRNGKPFGLLKFRTMRPDTNNTSEWVRDNTHRITRVGWYLRRFRLDELPQLINVLRGEMNLVGPRPHPTCNHTVFTKEIAYYRVRSSVRPGVTGWAQIRYGYANDLEEETEKMRYDLYYIKNRSLGLDLRILAQTVVTMLLGRGASEVRGRAPEENPRALASRRRAAAARITPSERPASALAQTRR